jgi:hypothetical protein
MQTVCLEEVGERAAEIIQGMDLAHHSVNIAKAAFVEFFSSDNPRFDEARFLAACVPGANVKARGKKVA